MAGDSKKLQPIIIKRVKKGGHAVHGGAWKIAYADFVTAMMAFFLLMWLLGSTTDGDKKGIADYFQSPLKIAMAGGSGSGDSNSVLSRAAARSLDVHGRPGSRRATSKPSRPRPGLINHSSSLNRCAPEIRPPGRPKQAGPAEDRRATMP